MSTKRTSTVSNSLKSTCEPFDIDEVFRRLRIAVESFPKAAMFDLRDRGFSSPFEQLVGSLISARTRDEVTLAIGLRLFPIASTPEELIQLGEARLVELLKGAAFREGKARDLIAIANDLIRDHAGQVPKDAEALQRLRGVGPKIAALTLAVGFGIPAIAVDIHVHRVTNRWGYVETRTPNQTMTILEEKLPKRYWIEINERLVPFGKFICTGTLPPRCSECSLSSMCDQKSVTDFR